MKNNGADFERAVFEDLKIALATGQLGLDPNLSRVRLRPKYLSFDRGTPIMLDVALEIKIPGDARPTIVWVWECKDTGRCVGIAKIEEFHAKLEQIGLHKCKGSMVATAGYDKTAITYANRKGIGLSRYDKANDRGIDRIRGVTAHRAFTFPALLGASPELFWVIVIFAPIILIWWLIKKSLALQKFRYGDSSFTRSGFVSPKLAQPSNGNAAPSIESLNLITTVFLSHFRSQ